MTKRPVRITRDIERMPRVQRPKWFPPKLWRLLPAWMTHPKLGPVRNMTDKERQAFHWQTQKAMYHWVPDPEHKGPRPGWSYRGARRARFKNLRTMRKRAMRMHAERGSGV